MSSPIPQSSSPAPEVEYSEEEFTEQSEEELIELPPNASTRTVAIIKNHALKYRFDIEPRILEANFEIVKELQMEFDTETDPETLYELFGEDAESFVEGPVWVYVLERRRAVEVWKTLMGDRDPLMARENTPTSLRALYGISPAQNGLMGSPDVQTAEIQIASLFASSPIYSTLDLPSESELSDASGMAQFPPGSLESSILSSLQRTTSGASHAHSSATNPSTVEGSPDQLTNANGKPVFRARAVPATHMAPDISPRTTKAAALRAGIIITDSYKPPKVRRTREEQTQVFMDVPGHKRSTTIAVASTAAPVIAPRMTKSAALRLGIPLPPVVKRQVSTASSNSETFEGVPGHKRRESFSVASTRPPSVGPRLNRSAALRQEKDKAPPTSYQFRAPVARTPSRQGSISRPSSAQSVRATPTMSRADSMDSSSAQKLAAAVRGRASSANTSRTTSIDLTPNPIPAPKPKVKPRLSSLQAPTIAPRPNRSAQLRAAQMEAANAKKPAPRGLMA